MRDEHEERFRQLVVAHQASLRAYVCRRVPDSAVDDVVAEVLAKAWQHGEGLPPRGDLWLYRAAWHVLLHRFRAEHRRGRLMTRLAAEPTFRDTGPDDQGAAESVQACIARMSIRDQEVLRLTYWDQLSAEEAALVIGGTAASVRVRLHRARRRLEHVLPEWIAGPSRRSPEPTVDHDPTASPGAHS
jgi:RNA polymerase sigma factor (sigma-70 family)